MTRNAPLLAGLVGALLFASSSLVQGQNPPAQQKPQPAPFQPGVAATGKPLVDRDCNACHARNFGGDAAKVYRRADRTVHSPKQLIAQVRFCTSQLALTYFPEEEEHVAAYLNLQYYKFEQ